MNITSMIIWLMALTILIGCKKKDDDSVDVKNDPDPLVETYFPLSMGNYWVYEHYKIDTFGNATSMNIIDSMVVVREEVINGEKFSILEGTNRPWSRQDWGEVGTYRDSMGYFVNDRGAIIFSYTNFQDILYRDTSRNGQDIIYTSFHKMIENTGQIDVPAGQFQTINFQGTITFTDFINAPIKERNTNAYYARGIGKVKESYFFASDVEHIEKRLIRYRVK